MNKKTMTAVTVGTALTLALVLAACAKNEGEGAKKVSSKSLEAAVVTNENGSVSRTFTECTITTNGSLVTEHRRETRTTTDTEGNMLETSTSEYAQSYPVGNVGLTRTLATTQEAASTNASEAASTDSFLGLSFGSVFAADEKKLVSDGDEPTLLRATFTPKKPLAGFDDYYVYVTPKTHRVVKIYACAKEAIDPGLSGRRHYLIEALEKRYQTWARLCSFRRPCYAFNLGDGRYVTACLAGSSREYETIVGACDNRLMADAESEVIEMREAARRTAEEQRAERVKRATDAF